MRAAVGGSVIANLRLTLILLILLAPCPNGPLSTVKCPLPFYVAHSSTHHDLTCTFKVRPWCPLSAVLSLLPIPRRRENCKYKICRPLLFEWKQPKGVGLKCLWLSLSYIFCEALVAGSCGLSLELYFLLIVICWVLSQDICGLQLEL